MSDTEIVVPHFGYTGLIYKKALMAADKRLRRQFILNLIQLAVALKNLSVSLMEKDELIPAFNIKDIAAVDAI